MKLQSQKSKVSAFTLMELTVSVAILAGVMAMVGMIFHTAGKATSQAKVSSTVYRELLFAAEAIRRDLDKVDPATQVMGIAGVTVLADETEKERNARLGQPTPTTPPPHRADVLMMFTQRSLEPYIAANSNIDTARVAQVIYGHANIGKVNAAGTGITATQFLEGSTIPGESDLRAVDWHLARQTTLYAAPIAGTPPGTANWPPTSNSFLQAQADVCTALPIDPMTGFPPPPFPKDVLSLFLHGRFHYILQGSVYVLNESYLKDSGYLYSNGNYFLFNQNYWWKWDTSAGSWRRDEPPGTAAATPPTPTQPHPPPPALDQTIFNNTNPQNPRYLPYWFYNGSNTRAVIDPTPPPTKNEQLSSYFLPSCSEFKVEFTYDDPHEIEVLPDASSNRIVDYWDLNNNATYEVGEPLAAKPIRWQSVPAGEQWIWSGLSVQPNSYGDVRNYTDPHRWPRALRITLRSYGGSDRLERPITYTLMHAFQ